MSDKNLRSHTWQKIQAASPGLDASAPREFVVGRSHDGFCSILAVEGEFADDQDLFFAQRFTSLPEAFEIAWDTGRSVFEIIHEDGREQLEEVLVELDEEDCR